MNVAFFRADGRKALGMGHLTRSLTLSRAMETAWSVPTSLVVGDDPAGREFLAARGVEPIWFDGDLSPAGEIAELVRLAGVFPGALFVFDTLQPAACEPALAALRRVGAQSMIVCDDTELENSSADLFLSGHLGLQPSVDPRRLLGATYFLLDPRFAEIEVPHSAGAVKRLALTLGGSDHCDLGPRVLRALADVAPGLTVEYALSRASGTVESLARLARRLELDVRFDVDPDGLLEFWQRADAALTAGGNTLFERVACRLPGATLCQIPLQQEHAAAMAALGVNVNLGMGVDCSEEDLRRGLDRFLRDTEEHQRQFERAPGVVDGRGTGRVLRRLESLGMGPGIHAASCFAQESA